MEIELSGEDAQLAFGARLAALLQAPCVLYLDGDLGTGKTTLTRGILRALGHDGPVRSPTYTLLEPYEVNGVALYHLDLYRLADPEELEYLGLRDFLAEPALWIIEWPQTGEGVLPLPDLHIGLSHLATGRRLRCTAMSPAGQALCVRLEAACEQRSAPSGGSDR